VRLGVLSPEDVVIGLIAHRRIIVADREVDSELVAAGRRDILRPIPRADQGQGILELDVECKRVDELVADPECQEERLICVSRGD
jgi:hypothetical protein